MALAVGGCRRVASGRVFHAYFAADFTNWMLLEALVGYENVINFGQSSSDTVIASGKIAIERIERRLSFAPGCPRYNGISKC